METENGIDENIFVGNIFIIVFFGLLGFIIHIVIVSLVEAYWLQGKKVPSR